MRFTRRELGGRMTSITEHSVSNQAKQRREEFMSRIDGGVAVFVSAPVATRNDDVEHEYRQSTDLYYLTGFEEPGAVAVLSADDEHPFVLFVQPKDREREVWNGRRVGVDGAVADYGADAAYSNEKLDEELPRLLGQADRIYHRWGVDHAFDVRLIKLMPRFRRERQRNGKGPTAIVDPSEVLGEMRLIKTEQDLELLRRAVEISCDGHLAAIRSLRPGVYEHEIEAVLRYVFRKNGSQRPGYPPIVASGHNSTVLHYTTNNRRIEEGDLLLIDAGTEFGYYTGDITRTFPASGSFTEEQASVYQVVLDAQLAAIEEIRPGADFYAPHNRAVRLLTEGLVRLGLLEGEVDKLIEEREYRKFYMHGTSHWLGMDVHDAGPYKVSPDADRKLEPGMVLTVEPGLYIAEDLEGIGERYKGIGIRIEDDVLVTPGGNEVLSARVPKTIEEIEGLMIGAHLGE